MPLLSLKRVLSVWKPSGMEVPSTANWALAVLPEVTDTAVPLPVPGSVSTKYSAAVSCCAVAVPLNSRHADRKRMIVLIALLFEGD